MAAGGGQLGADLRAPGGEGPHHRRVDPGQLVGAPCGGRPLDPQDLGQPVAEVGAVEGAGGPGVGTQAAAVERRPPPVGAVAEVGHHHVGVQVGVVGPAQPVGEAGGHQAVDRLGPALVARPPADRRRPAGHVAHRRLHGALVGRQDLGRHLGRREGEEDADRLGGREGEVDAGHPAPPGHQGPPVARPASGQHRLQVPALDRPRQPEAGRPGAGPEPGTILSAPAGNPGGAELGRQVVEVVPAGAVGQAGDAQHVGAGRPAAREPPCAEHARAGVRFESWRSWRVSGKPTIIAGVPGQQGRASTPISDAVGTRAGSTRGRCRRKAPRSSCASSACANPTGPRSPPVPRERRSFSLSFMPFDASAGGVASEHPASRGGTRPPQLGRVEHPGPRPEL